MLKEKYEVIFFPPAGKGLPEVYPLEGWFGSKAEAEEAVRNQYPEESDLNDYRYESWVVSTETQMAHDKNTAF